MVNYETPFEDTLEIFKNKIYDAGLVDVKIKILTNNKLKKLHVVNKVNELTQYLTEELGGETEVSIQINEEIFEKLNDAQKQMIAEEIIAEVYFDLDKDKTTIKKHDVSGFSGIMKKFGIEDYLNTKLLINEIISQSEDKEAELNN